MTQRPPTGPVSATLAQVYIQQDHHEQARRMLARVLQVNPYHGHALALLTRLQAKARARLYASLRPGRGLAIRWHDAPIAADLHLIAAVFQLSANQPVADAAKTSPQTTVYVTSSACRSASGEHLFALPHDVRGPATATLCLAHWDGEHAKPIAVHEPLSW